MAILNKTFNVSADELHLFIRSVLSLFKDYQGDHHEYLVKSFYRYSNKFEDEYAEYLEHIRFSTGFLRRTHKKNKKEIFESLKAWKDLYYICFNTADDIKNLKDKEVLDALHFKELGFAAEKEALFSKNLFEKRLELLAFFEERAFGFVHLFNELNIQSNEALQKREELVGDDSKQKYPDFLMDLVYVGILSSIAPFIEKPQNHKHQIRYNIKKLFKTINFHAVFCMYSDYYFRVAQQHKRIIMSELEQKHFNHFYSSMWCDVILDVDFDIDKFLVSDLEKYNKKYGQDGVLEFVSFYGFLNEALAPEENIDTSNQKTFEVKNQKDIRHLFDMLKIMNVYSEDIINFQELVAKPFSEKIDKSLSHSEAELVACQKFVKSLLKKYKLRSRKQSKDVSFITNSLAVVLYRTLKSCNNINTDTTLKRFAYSHFIIISDVEFKKEKGIPETDSQLDNAISVFAKNMKPAQTKQVKKAA